MSDTSQTVPAAPTPRPSRGSGAVFGLVVGIFVGVLVAALVVPKRQDVDVVRGAPQASTQPAADVDAGGEPVALEGGATGDPGGSGAPVAGGEVRGSAPAPGEEAGDAPPSTGAGPGGGESFTGDDMPVVAERGVAEDRVTVGIALIDVGPVVGAAPQFDQGEPEKFYEAILKAWRGDGTLPVHGRDVTFIYRRYAALDSNEQRAACKYLIEDRKVFALVATVQWQVGANCSARELKTPTLTSDGVHERTLTSANPYLFSMPMSEDRQLRNVAHWAHTKKLIKGKIGIYYLDESVEAELVRRTIVAELKKLGHTVVEATSNTDQSSQNDLLAVRRFQQENVETVFVFNSREGFTNAAQGQRYKPRYLDADHMYGTTDSNTTTYNAEQYEGTLAFTGRRGGEFQAGIKRSPEQQRCVEMYKAHTGEDLEDDTFKFQMAMHACDLANTLMAGMQRAGTNLTRDSFVAGFETIKDQPLARSANATFAPGKHDGADAYRTLQWQSSCRCFKAVEDFAPLLVP